ncbi:hypothetical protein NC652_005426 [Populus alba x Populus x berolinensis]|nr:hypothetical protein NC652_005426 [Populus alba x Populus x berolinensis]
MASLSTWCRYIAHKFEYSLSLSYKSYKGGIINNKEVYDTVWKNLFQGKLTFLHWNKGREMAPTIGDQGGTLLVRKLPTADPMRVFVGDVVLLKDPEKSDDFLVRRLAAIEGYEMVSADEKDDPFVLDKDECWVLADNDKLKPKEANDSRTFGPISMSNIVGRVIYCLQTAVDHGPVQNSHFSMRKDSPVLEVELDVCNQIIGSSFATIGSWLFSIWSYGSSEGRCLPFSGISGRAVAVSPCSSRGVHYVHSQAQFGKMKCSSRASSIVCKSSGGHRRNPDFSRQNRQGFSRNRNRQNEEGNGFENLDESDLLTSKNGPLLSLSGTPKFQATAAPGPREKEIVELFRKVQAQLRERAAVKEEKKVEASQGKGRENETVDSLLKLLRKHSVEQDQPENGTYKKANSTSFFDSSKKERNDVLEPITSFTRPPSNFRRKSPVPQVKFQPIYSSEDPVNSTSHLNLNAA